LAARMLIKGILQRCLPLKQGVISYTL